MDSLKKVGKWFTNPLKQSETPQVPMIHSTAGMQAVILLGKKLGMSLPKL